MTYDYSTSTSSNTTSLASLVVLTVFALAMTFIYTLPLVIAYWKLFTKAGYPGWASIVPFYSTWVMVKIGRGPSWLFWAILASGILSIIPGVGFISFGLSIYLIVLFAQQYDRGAGFWILLYLLPIVGVFKVKDANYKSDPTMTPTSTPMAPLGAAPTAAPMAATPAPLVQPAPPISPPPVVNPAPPTPPTPPTTPPVV
jgi:hypothetical protein